MTLEDQIIGKFNWHKDIWIRGFFPKLKVFMWSCLHKALPVGENLHRRSIADVGCPRSGEYESTEHMLFSCPFAIQVWNQVPILNTTHIASITDEEISSKIQSNVLSSSRLNHEKHPPLYMFVHLDSVESTDIRTSRIPFR